MQCAARPGKATHVNSASYLSDILDIALSIEPAFFPQSVSNFTALVKYADIISPVPSEQMLLSFKQIPKRSFDELNESLKVL